MQSEKFVKDHQGRLGDISIYGQESNPTTWKLAKMNLAIRGIDNNLGPEHADSFHRDLHKDLEGRLHICQSAFNSDWGGERLREDARWKFGALPVGNATAWVQHFIYHLAPWRSRICPGQWLHVLQPVWRGRDPQEHHRGRPGGLHGALPGQLFCSTQIPACLWFLGQGQEERQVQGPQG